jgi:dienelactone hydrolase
MEARRGTGGIAMKCSTAVANALCIVCFFVSALLASPCYAQQGMADAIYNAALPLYSNSSTDPLAPQVVASGVNPESTWQKVTYLGKTDRVSGLLFLPIGASAAKPAPCLILLHGLGGSKEQMIPVARFFASIGYASFAIDNYGAGERALSTTVPAYADAAGMTVGVDTGIITTVVDLRRGIDYLDTRPEIDQKHIAAFGFSLGSIIGTLLASVDPRVCALIVVSGGGNLGKVMVDEAKSNVAFGKMYQSLLINVDPTVLEQSLAPVDPVNFVAHVSPRPILMEHGDLDKLVPPDSAQALYDAALQPKLIVWYPNAGHVPPPLEVFPSVSIFLDKYLPTPGR